MHASDQNLVSVSLESDVTKFILQNFVKINSIAKEKIVTEDNQLSVTTSTFMDGVSLVPFVLTGTLLKINISLRKM